MSAPSALKAWALAARPKTLAAGVVPVLVGTAVAHLEGRVRPSAALACAVCSILIQVATNLANDYFDAKKGADNERRLGPARAVQQGWISPQRMLLGTGISLILAFALGLYLIHLGGAVIAAIGIISLVAAVAYTGGPYPLAYVGLGDLFVFLFFGLAAVVGTTWVQTLTAPPAAWVGGAATGFLATAILVVNNLRDRETDAEAQKRTLVVRLGPTFARREHASLIGAAFLVVGIGALMGWVPVAWLGLSILCLPLAASEIRSVHQKDGRDLNPHLGGAARLELFFGLALVAGSLL